LEEILQFIRYLDGVIKTNRENIIPISAIAYMRRKKLNNHLSQLELVPLCCPQNVSVFPTLHTQIAKSILT